MRFSILLTTILFLSTPIPLTFAEDTWRMYPDPNYILDIAAGGDAIWCATQGGILCRNKADNSYRVYTQADGLPGNHIVALTLGNNKDLWCIIGDNVLSFDGTTWKNHTVEGELPLASYQALAIDTEGAVWLGSVTGLVRYDGAGSVAYTASNGLPDNNITCVHIGPDNTVWAGTRKGLSRFNGKTWDTMTTADGLPSNRINDITSDAQGNLWVATVGVSRYDGSAWKTYTTQDGIVGNTVLSLAAEKNGTIWAGSSEGLSKFTGASWTPVSRAETGRSVDTVRAIAVDDDNAVWIDNDYRGLSGYDGISWKQYTISGLLYCWGTYVNCGAVDNDGVIWFGNDHSLASFDGTSWKNIEPENLFSLDGVTAIAAEGNSGKWIGTGNGLFRFDGENWFRYSTDTGLPGNIIRAIAVSVNGTKWVGTDSGLAAFDGGDWNVYTTSEGLPDNRIKQLAVDLRNNLWVVTEKGASRFNGSEWTNFPNEMYFGSGYATSVAVDKNNVKWFGSQWCIFSFDDSVWKTYTEQDTGFPLGMTVKAVAVDQNNTKWFGTGGAGIVRFDETRWDRFVSHLSGASEAGNTHFVNIPNDYITTIVVDSNNAIWFGCYDGGVFNYSGNVSDYTTSVNTRASTPADLAIRGVYPNPFNPSTTIEFVLPSAGRTELAVYDVTGRKVRTLFSGSMSAGKHALVWDGRDGAGKPVSSGVYISQVRAGGKTVSGRMTLVK